MKSALRNKLCAEWHARKRRAGICYDCPRPTERRRVRGAWTRFARCAECRAQNVMISRNRKGTQTQTH